MPLLDPTLIRVDIEEHLRDCPPWDEPIDETLIPEFAAEIARRFDYTAVYDQIDQLGCQLLREHKLKPAVNELVGVILNPGDYPSDC